MGSTVSFVTAMMKASQVTFRSLSRSFLLSHYGRETAPGEQISGRHCQGSGTDRSSSTWGIEEHISRQMHSAVCFKDSGRQNPRDGCLGRLL